MSFLTEINCRTILEAIKNEKLRQKDELQNESGEYIRIPQVNLFWTDIFANCFLCYDVGKDEAGYKTNSLTQDDMLFFVNINGNKSEIEVYRRDSKLLPCLTNFNYEWEETVYLNLILHEFEYTLTCAICTQTGTKDLEILKRHSKRVYASPSKRDLASKGTEETLTYPNLYFIIDDFDEAFNEMIVNENEMICVELVANDGQYKKVLFLGSIKYESLKRVYDARASTSTKLVQKISLGAFADKRVEFVRMKGPAGKGYAEMAVSHHQDSTITSSASENFTSDTFQNLLKLPSVFKKRPSEIQTKADSEKNFHQDLSRYSIWDRTFGQAMTWLNKPVEDSKESFEIKDYNEQVASTAMEEKNEARASQSNPQSIPLNAYLTYVTLKLQIIMQDVLEARHKSLLTA